MALTKKDIDPRTLKRMANEYISARYVTFKTLATKYRTTPTTISNILWQGIAENIIDYKVAKCIYNKVIDKPTVGWYQRKLRWDEAFEAREIGLKKLEQDAMVERELITLNSVKEYYENAIASYDNYFFDEDNCPSLEELNKNLDAVKRQIARLLS